MPKIEFAIKEAIDRGARRHTRQVATPLRREVRRLRQLVAGFRKDLAALKATAAQWARLVDQTPWTAAVSDEAAKAALLSARLVRKLQTRLGLSQAALGRLVGVTGAAVVEWGARTDEAVRRAAEGGRRAPGARAPGRQAPPGPDAEAGGAARTASGSLSATASSPGVSTATNANTENSSRGVGQVSGVDQPGPTPEPGALRDSG